jgi:FkbM family methyltransferase
MMLKQLPFKILKKLNLLGYFNLSRTISYAGNNVLVPVVNSVGYPNLFLRPNWLYILVERLLKSESEAFLDVGANIGQTLIAVKTINPKIEYIGFEPSASCFYYLKLLIRGNSFTNCSVYNFALSDRQKETMLETNSEADPTGSIVHNLRPGFFQNQDSVFSLTFDSLGLKKKIGCVKIDVEGGELEVLTGMHGLLLEHRPVILCEVLDSFSDNALEFTQNRANQVCQLLNELDYTIIQIIQNEATDRILSFQLLDRLSIQQWRKESLTLNDYIFVPSEKLEFVQSILAELCPDYV